MTRAKQRAKKQQHLAQNPQSSSHKGHRYRPPSSQHRPNVATRSDRHQHGNQDNTPFRELDPCQNFASSARQRFHAQHQPPLLQNIHHLPHQGAQGSLSSTHMQTNHESRPTTNLQGAHSQVNSFPQQQANLQAGTFATSGMHNVPTGIASPNQTNFHQSLPLNPEQGFEEFMGNQTALYGQVPSNQAQPIGNHLFVYLAFP